MKRIFDAIQIALSIPGFGFVVAFLLVVITGQALKLICAAISGMRIALSAGSKLIFKFWGFRRVALLCLFALPVYLLRDQVSYGIQYIEQYYIDPVYIIPDSSAWAVMCYESELQKHVTQEQFIIVRDSTYRLAQELGCDPLSIYEVAYSECALNPFCVRADGIAAGWIQFTAAGLKNFGVSLPEVKQWCSAGNAQEMMRMTGKYLRYWAAGRKLPTSTDIYCAVFAPGKIHLSPDKPLYSGWSNPEYYLNKGLDGYRIQDGKGLYFSSWMDGKLTKRDLSAALAYKKSVLLKKYTK